MFLVLCCHILSLLFINFLANVAVAESFVSRHKIVFYVGFWLLQWLYCSSICNVSNAAEASQYFNDLLSDFQKDSD